VGRVDVLEQDVLGDAELGERPVDDRRGRLGRPGPRQLALRGERQPGDPCAAVARRLADEQEARVAARVEIGLEPPAPNRCACPIAVEIGRLPDAGGDQPVD
jgi:hypothetical protein